VPLTDFPTPSDICILFLYHRVDSLTLSNLAALRASNPDCTVLPLSDRPFQSLPGAVDVSEFGDFHGIGTSDNKWRSTDTVFYRWFQNRKFDSERYLLLEYDTLVTTSIRKFYFSVWDADIGCVDYFKLPDRKDWEWFSPAELEHLGAELRPYAAGIMPGTCTLVSHRAALRIVEALPHHPHPGVFSELRLGTWANYLGLNLMRLPDAARRTIRWHEYFGSVQEPGIYHSVKTLKRGGPEQWFRFARFHVGRLGWRLLRMIHQPETFGR